MEFSFSLKMLQKRDFLIVFILFLIGFILRFYFADFLKHFVIYPDELRYYHLAENIANCRGLLIYNTETNFQKILYPLFLSPAFLFENREIQQHAFAFINAFLVCASIFPAFLIARSLLQKKSSILIVCAIALILPDLNYSLTFMSENLYIPLSLWVFYAYLQFILTPPPPSFTIAKIRNAFGCFVLCTLFVQRNRRGFSLGVFTLFNSFQKG